MKRKLVLFLCLALMLVGVTACNSTEAKTESNISEAQEEYPERTSRNIW